MDYEYTEDERILLRTVRDFGERRFTDENVSQWRRDEGLPDEVVRGFVGLDFHGFEVVPGEGHGRYDLLAQVLVLEELARASGAVLPFPSDFVSLWAADELSSGGELDFALDRYRVEGRPAFACATYEPQSAPDLLDIRARVELRGGRLVLNGIKTFVNEGEYAPYLLVSAVDARHQDELSFWLVPRICAGLRAYPIDKVGQSLQPSSTLVFTDVELEESWRLHTEGQAEERLLSLFDIARLFDCATALGEAQAAMEDAVAYARGHEAYGAPVSDLSLEQELLVDMEVRLQAMRAAVYRSALLMDSDAPADQGRLSVTLAKRMVPAAATQVASDAMQVMALRGYTRSQRASSIWQDCRGFQMSDGTDQIIVNLAAPLLIEKYEDRADGI